MLGNARGCDWRDRAKVPGTVTPCGTNSQSVTTRQSPKQSKRHGKELGPCALHRLIEELADLFASDNGQFKRDRFKRACELGANVRARS
jgi:hypothetical protein